MESNQVKHTRKHLLVPSNLQLEKWDKNLLILKPNRLSVDIQSKTSVAMTSIAPKTMKSCDRGSQNKVTTSPNDDSLVSKTACTSKVQAKPKRYDINSQRTSLDEYQESKSFTDELAVDYENSSDENDDTTTPSCVVAKSSERFRSRTPSPVYSGDVDEVEVTSSTHVGSKPT